MIAVLLAGGAIPFLCMGARAGLALRRERAITLRLSSSQPTVREKVLYSLQDEYRALPAASRRRVRAKVMELLASEEAAVQRAAIIAGFSIMEMEDREEMLPLLGGAAEAYNKRPLGQGPWDRVCIAKEDGKYTIGIEMNEP